MPLPTETPTPPPPSLAAPLAAGGPAAAASARGRLVVLSGPSGSGKTTVCARLLDDPRFRRAITATTRPRRPGEVDGVDYVFLDAPTFRERIARGDFLEWAEVYGHLYGTPRGPIERDLDAGRFVLVNIDTQGAATLRARGGGAVSIFLLPPSMHVLEARLRERRTDSEEVIQRRLARAEAELAEAVHYEHRVINDTVERAAEEARRIVLARAAQAEVGRVPAGGAAGGRQPT